MSENYAAIAEEYSNIALKILVPLDKAINKIHMKNTVREVYFALADAREKLIQFVNLPNKYKKNDELNGIVQKLLPVLLQMNLLLNQMIKSWPKDRNFTDKMTSLVIERFIVWRTAITEVTEALSTGINGVQTK